MARQHTKRIRIKAKRLSQLDNSQLALAIWLMAKVAIEEESKRQQPGPEPTAGIGGASTLREVA